MPLSGPPCPASTTTSRGLAGPVRGGSEPRRERCSADVPLHPTARLLTALPEARRTPTAAERAVDDRVESAPPREACTWPAIVVLATPISTLNAPHRQRRGGSDAGASGASGYREQRRRASAGAASGRSSRRTSGTRCEAVGVSTVMLRRGRGGAAVPATRREAESALLIASGSPAPFRAPRRADASSRACRAASFPCRAPAPPSPLPCGSTARAE